MTKKKVALISVWNHNYGSLLQTFAMQKFLDSHGYENEIILYKEGSVLVRVWRLMNFSHLIAKYKIISRRLAVLFKYPKLLRVLNVRDQSFISFKEDFLRFSQTISSKSELKRTIRAYSQVVLGSDQVFHPANLLMDYFTLNFVPDGMKKIGYAPSFGVSEIPKMQWKRTAYFLNRFEFLSVREDSGGRIIKSLINRDVPTVCDPTMLIDIKYWNLLKGEKQFVDGQYIFCYFLGTNKLHRKLANDLKKDTGLKIVSLPHLTELVKADREFGDVQPFNVGPKEFVNLIANAKFVLTDSFHGSIFSILFCRNFLVFNRYSGTTNMSTNSRIHTLLGQLDLQSRNVISKEEFDRICYQEIDYSLIKEKIDSIRRSSIDYISNALQA